MTNTSQGRTIQRKDLAITGAVAIVLATFASAACSGKEFTSCADTMTCPPPQKDAGGAAGESAGGASNNTSSAGGSTSAGGSSAGATSPCTGTCEADNAVATCSAEGQCVISSCAENFADCNEQYADGCETAGSSAPPTPLLLAPMIGEYTGSVHAEKSLRPTLRWRDTAKSACGGLKYEIQMDDSCPIEGYAKCTFPSPEVDAKNLTETKWQPEKSLPVSTKPPVGTRYAWRVRACDITCSDWSQVRYLDVGRMRDDLNGDGYAETVAVRNAQRSMFNMVHIWQGSADLNATPIQTTANTDPFSDFPIAAESRMRFLGDVDGDGFSDLLITHSENSVRVILGALDLANATPIPFSFADGAAFPYAGRAGDWNADGYADFAVGRPEVSGSKIYVFFGGAKQAFSTKRKEDVILASPNDASKDMLGAAVDTLGDLNGDGIPELAAYSVDDDKIVVWRNSTASATILQTGRCYEPGEPARRKRFLATAGDLNGDGFSDAVVTCDRSIWVYLGGAELPSAPHWTLPDAAADVYGPVLELVAGSDLGNDGHPDILVINEKKVGDDLAQTVRFYPGGPKFLQNMTPSEFNGAPVDLNSDVELFPTFTSAATGDINGDGRHDLTLSYVTDRSRAFSHYLRQYVSNVGATEVRQIFDFSEAEDFSSGISQPPYSLAH